MLSLDSLCAESSKGCFCVFWGVSSSGSQVWEITGSTKVVSLLQDLSEPLLCSRTSVLSKINLPSLLNSTKLSIDRGQPAFKTKGHTVNILGFASHLWSVLHIFFPYSPLKMYKSFSAHGLCKNRSKTIYGCSYSLLNSGL